MMAKGKKLTKDDVKPLFSDDAVTSDIQISIDMENGGTLVDTASPNTIVEKEPLANAQPEPTQAPIPEVEGPKDLPTSKIEVEPGSEPVPEPEIEEKPYTREDFILEMREMAGPQRKSGAPCLIAFNSKTSNARRWVLVDVNDGIFDDGWNLYQDKIGCDEEEYLACVYDALQLPVPRMFRNVVYKELKRRS